MTPVETVEALIDRDAFCGAKDEDDESREGLERTILMQNTLLLYHENTGHFYTMTPTGIACEACRALEGI